MSLVFQVNREPRLLSNAGTATISLQSAGGGQGFLLKPNVCHVISIHQDVAHIKCGVHEPGYSVPGLVFRTRC